jgi:hypothetical protein
VRGQVGGHLHPRHDQDDRGIADVAARHRRDFVDHDSAWLFDPGGGGGFQRDPGQWRLDRVVVSGQTVTEAVASKRSSWMITTGLGFPV